MYEGEAQYPAEAERPSEGVRGTGLGLAWRVRGDQAGLPAQLRTIPSGQGQEVSQRLIVNHKQNADKKLDESFEETGQNEERRVKGAEEERQLKEIRPKEKRLEQKKRQELLHKRRQQIRQEQKKEAELVPIPTVHLPTPTLPVKQVQSEKLKLRKTSQPREENFQEEKEIDKVLLIFIAIGHHQAWHCRTKSTHSRPENAILNPLK